MNKEFSLSLDSAPFAAPATAETHAQITNNPDTHTEAISSLPLQVGGIAVALLVATAPSVVKRVLNLKK